MIKYFLRYVGQTSPKPMGIEVERAEGIYLYSPDNRRYIDLISGVSVSNVGHSNKRVVEAVCAQAQKYMHLMVYGEMIQTPQIEIARKISKYLPDGIDNIYLVNSGSEAIEGAMKLAKRYTGRTELISCKNSYHGSTQGALSIMGSEFFKNSFRPLLPDVGQIVFNDIDSLSAISERTAAVIIEPIQGEGGFRIPTAEFIAALRQKCDETGTLLIFDEIQTGFGRTGKMFAWEKIGVKPDIICMAKAMGGGMPLGGFAATKEMMDTLTFNPVLGHITTFGGHPVSAAAGLAAIEYIEDEKLLDAIESKSQLFYDLLKNAKNLKEIRRCGLMIAMDFGSEEVRDKIVARAVDMGVVTEGFLFCTDALRVAPPLIISEDEIRSCCSILLKACEI
ncbi:MAG: aspartate aminotransferase family protein [Rikenellaceae bacterium]